MIRTSRSRARHALVPGLVAALAAASMVLLASSPASADHETQRIAEVSPNIGFETTAITADGGGTLDNEVSWTEDHVDTFGCGTRTWNFDQTVDLAFGINGYNNNEGVILPAGTVADSISSDHNWDAGTLTLTHVSGNQTALSTFTLPAVSSLTVEGTQMCELLRNVKYIDVTSDDLAHDPDAPVVTINSPEDGAVYEEGQEVLADYECTPDGDLTVDTLDGTVPNGDPIDTSPGTHSFEVTCVDSEGGSTTETVTYSVPVPCVEDGFAALQPPHSVIDLSPVAVLDVQHDPELVSGVVHDIVEPTVNAVVDPLTEALLTLSVTPIVHDLNCQVVVPLEDALDPVLIEVVNTVETTVGGLLGSLFG